MKNRRTKIITLFIMFIILMTTLVSYKVYATPEKEDIEENAINNEELAIGTEVEKDFNNLSSEAMTLCCEHGGPIKISDGVPTIASHTHNQAYNLMPKYKVIENVICTPKQAYILNYSNDNAQNYASYVQVAWWKTKANIGAEPKKDEEYIGSATMTNADKLEGVASAYQTFVQEQLMTKKEDIENTAAYESLTHNGTTIQFPKVDVKSKFKLTTDQVRVLFRETDQKYIIGPFLLEYPEQFNADEVFGGHFGQITGFNIYTDESKDAVANTKWKFKDENDNQINYPKSGNQFYIEMDYIEGATKMTGMDIDYRYLIAGGEYQLLKGSYIERIFTCTTHEEDDGEDENGDPKTKTVWDCTINDVTHPAQALGLVVKAARWYKTEKISFKANQATLKIKKEVLDENDNPLTAQTIKDQYGEQLFAFKVTVTYPNRTGKNHKITTIKEVPAGETVTVGNYMWGKDEAAPTYTVEEITPLNDTWEARPIDNTSGTLGNGSKVIVTATNKMKPKKRKIELIKTTSEPVKEDEEFKFSVDVTMPNGKHDISEATVTVQKGKTTSNTWTSKEYKWIGNEDPTYEITEIETEASKKYTPSITPSKGELEGSGANVQVKAYNTIPVITDEAISYLRIKKELLEGQVTQDTFSFKVMLDGVKNTDSGHHEFTVTGLKANETAEYSFEWKDPNIAPTYTVEEIDPKGGNVSTIEETVNGTSRVEKNTNKISGTLTKEQITDETTGETRTDITEIKFTNNMTEHHGNIKVVKNFTSAEKMTDEELKAEIAKLDPKVKFDVKVVLKGSFKYKGELYENTTKVIDKTLSKDNNWQFTIDDVYWWGETTPTYTVTELRSQQVNWECIGQNYSNPENESTNEEGFKLVDGKTVEVTVINQIPSDIITDLTFEMAGIVWVDETIDDKNNDKEGYYNKPNGVYDDGETLKDNAEVVVYKVFYDASGKEVKREEAKAYKDAQNNELSFPIVTITDGAWDVPRIQVPGVTAEEKANYGCETASYDVEFTYDGQTYEPTEFLSYKVSNNGTVEKNQGSNKEKAKEYRKAEKSVKKKYEKDSMALGNSESKIAKISGKTEINENGETTGIVTLTDGREVEITYSSNDAGVAYPTHSTLNTIDSNGRILDIFRATASTAAGNLTFPFDVSGYDGSSLTAVDKIFSTEGFTTKYKFMAVYDYCLHINLGLKEREEVDIGLTKNLDSATVVVNEKMYQYKYSGYYDLTENKTDSLNKDIIYVSNPTEKFQYTLGLYRSDYYYRAEMYQNSNDENNIYDKLSTFYSSINGRDKSEALKDTELDIYLTYKIKVQNSSAAYKVKIHEIDDYYDSSLILVREDEQKYLKTRTERVKEGDEVKVKEIPVNAMDVVAEKSAYADNWHTVKTGIVGSDTNGNGKNIVYNKMTAYNLGIELDPGESEEFYVRFKVDKDKDDEFGIEDSIKLGQKCNVAEIASYSTIDAKTGKNAGKIDRDSAPGNVNISMHNEKSWYEDDTFAAPRIKLNLIDGTLDRTIDGVVWEDDSTKDNTEKPDSDYNQTIGNAKKDDNEKTIPGLTTELVQKVDIPDENNPYLYTEYDYIWPTNVELDCLNGKSMETVLGLDTTIETKDDGTYTFNNVIAGDYVVRFTYGDMRPYNTTGGDYKIEVADYSKNDPNEEKYYNGQDYKSSKFNANLRFGKSDLQPDSYLDIDEVNKYDTIRNTAVDSEVRRLKVVEKSREINNHKSTIMDEYASELFKEYYMYADTPKLDMNIELSANYYSGLDNTDYNYEVKNIDFGLEERPITQLSLDKQIKEIILTTSDGNNIMDAKYIISYTVNPVNGEITANVDLDMANSYGIDNLQALNRDDATNNGFRYINVDSAILEGTTITVKYQFTVLNTGEVDRTGRLEELLYKDDITQFSGPDSTYGDKGRIGSLADNFAKFEKATDGSLQNNKPFGEYLGNIYYYGTKDKQLFDYGEDYIVTTRVRQLVDYVDNDVEFNGNFNNTENMSWGTITVEELSKHIAEGIITSEGVILDKDEISYTTDNRTNLIVSVDESKANGESDRESNINNNGFIINLQPENAAKQDDNQTYFASMYLTTTKYVSGDADDLQIDNIAEIIRYNNKVGRRDELTVAGNEVPAETLENFANQDRSLSSTLKYERDTSATEVITLSPPTGTSLMMWKLQVIASITGGLAIMAGGIIFIKKKVLK